MARRAHSTRWGLRPGIAGTQHDRTLVDSRGRKRGSQSNLAWPPRHCPQGERILPVEREPCRRRLRTQRPRSSPVLRAHHSMNNRRNVIADVRQPSQSSRPPRVAATGTSCCHAALCGRVARGGSGTRSAHSLMPQAHSLSRSAVSPDLDRQGSPTLTSSVEIGCFRPLLHPLDCEEPIASGHNWEDDPHEPPPRLLVRRRA